MDDLYKLLDDCHTVLAKTKLDDKKYNELSSRLIAQKQALLQANVSGSLLISFGAWLQHEGWGWKLDNTKERWGRAKKNWNGKGDYWEWKSSKQLLELFYKRDEQ